MFNHQELFVQKHIPFQRSVLRLAVFAACALGATGSALAANATATSTGTVVTPIAIAKTADLAFGKFAAPAAGSVTISTSGARTIGGGVLPVSGGATTAARFDVTGDTGATYSIALSGTTVLTSGSDTMAFATVSDLTAGNATSGNVSSGTLAGGAQSIYVGGVLTVGASQPAGSYSGTVIATVEYN
jgi:spore coat protein U-like protein